MPTQQRIKKYLNTVHLQSYITTEQMYAYIIDTYIIKQAAETYIQTNVKAGNALFSEIVEGATPA